MRFCCYLILSTLTAPAAQAGDHPCAADAIIRAGQLLHLHWDQADSKLAELPDVIDETGNTTAWSLDTAVVQLPPVKALQGKGHFDVLEVTGYVYKASYRMHLLYAQIPDTCVLMGQEIIEVADPY